MSHCYTDTSRIDERRTAGCRMSSHLSDCNGDKSEDTNNDCTDRQTDAEIVALGSNLFGDIFVRRTVDHSTGHDATLHRRIEIVGAVSKFWFEEGWQNDIRERALALKRFKLQTNVEQAVSFDGTHHKRTETFRACSLRSTRSNIALVAGIDTAVSG